MLESIEQSESALVSKLSDLEVDLLAKQQESDLQLVDLRTKLEDQLQSFLSNVRLPLSISFSAFRDTDYSGKGEDYLTFTGCSVNNGGAMDHKYVLYYQLYLLSSQLSGVASSAPLCLVYTFSP